MQNSFDCVIHRLGEVCYECTSAVAMGFFDGVHWGHRAIFQKLISVAEEKKLQSIALTFDIHPSELLAPKHSPGYISTFDQRIDYIMETGVKEVVVAEFGTELSQLDPDQFIKHILIDKLNAKHIIVGANFRFGKDRAGDIRHLQLKSEIFGFEIDVVPSVIIDGEPVSSTRIRSKIAHGDLSAAESLLGHPFVLRGEVVKGRQVGRQIGFPTANIQTSSKQLIPGNGVYSVSVEIDDKKYCGVCSIGNRPTFDNGEISIEVHIKDFDGDLYGKTLDSTFIKKIREERKFSSSSDLIKQIEIDLKEACI